MENAHNILIKLWEFDTELYIFSIDLRMGHLKFVGAGKFWKLLAQLASSDFGQSFTPALEFYLDFK